MNAIDYDSVVPDVVNLEKEIIDMLTGEEAFVQN